MEQTCKGEKGQYERRDAISKSVRQFRMKESVEEMSGKEKYYNL